MISLLAGAIAFASITAAIPAFADTASDPDPFPLRRAMADRALAEGRFEDARTRYASIIASAPYDAQALREAGRAAHALADFPAAADLLARADAEIRTPDPELHYLLGEALWALHRTSEARTIHERARTELVGHAAERMPKLWLARIEGRLADFTAADRIYDALIATNAADEEASLAQVEMHANAQRWSQAERAVRRFLTAVPGHRRGQELLAWIAEAQGHLDGELAIRERLARGTDKAEALRDYGRVLERSGNWAGALVAYRKALTMPGASVDATLSSAVDRMDRRMSPELAAGFAAKSDPGAESIAAYVGTAVPFGRAHHFALGGWHELAFKNGRQGYGGELAAAFALRARSTQLIAGAKVGVYQFADTDLAAKDHARIQPGGFGSVATQLLGGHVELRLDAELGSVWRETPRAVLEGGSVDSVTSHFFGVLLGHRLVTDTGVQLRRLQLDPTMAGTANAMQALLWTGADLALWTDFSSQATGESLDDDLLRPTYLADSVVAAYRHYELWGESNTMFSDRMSMANRASIDELSMVARKAIADGRVAVEAHAGGGRDWARQLFISRAGGSIWIAPTTRSRLSLSVDLVKESARALQGERRSGWMTYHVDL